MITLVSLEETSVLQTFIDGEKIDMEPVDPSKKHFYISLVKSAVRIVAGVFLVMGNFVLAGLFLIAAEGLGIIEEL